MGEPIRDELGCVLYGVSVERCGPKKIGLHVILIVAMAMPVPCQKFIHIPRILTIARKKEIKVKKATRIVGSTSVATTHAVLSGFPKSSSYFSKNSFALAPLIAASFSRSPDWNVARPSLT